MLTPDTEPCRTCYWHGALVGALGCAVLALAIALAVSANHKPPEPKTITATDMLGCLPGTSASVEISGKKQENVHLTCKRPGQ